MKRYAALFLSLLLLVAMTACGEQSAASSSPDGEESPPVRTPGLQVPEKGDKKPVDTKDPEQATDPDLAYSELVERFRALVSDPFGQDSDEPGEMGVLESARAAGDNAVYEMGYLIEDLSGDGIPELAVGGLNGMTNALYTLVDGKPKLSLRAGTAAATSTWATATSTTTVPTVRRRTARACFISLKTGPGWNVRASSLPASTATGMWWSIPMKPEAGIRRNLRCQT